METRRIYITAEEGRTFSFPYDWKQTFDHPFEMSRAVNEAQIVKTYVSEEADRQIGLEVLKLLFDFTFATRDQLERLLFHLFLYRQVPGYLCHFLSFVSKVHLILCWIYRIAFRRGDLFHIHFPQIQFGKI